MLLHTVQTRNFIELATETGHRGRYYHEYTLSVVVTRGSPTRQPPSGDAEEIVTEPCVIWLANLTARYGPKTLMTCSTVKRGGKLPCTKHRRIPESTR